MVDDARRVDDETIVKILTDSHVWAVVGWSPRPDRPSHRVARFLHDHGKRVIPVNPTCPGADSDLGAAVVSSLDEIDGPIDVVDVFRRSAHAGIVVDEAVARGAEAVWLQLGVIDEEAADRARAAGLDVVMDRCPAIEWPRLLA
jgi:predicted CoA-binding protein